MSEIEQIEGKIFVFTINIESFLKVLAADNLNNSLTEQLENYNTQLKELYEKLTFVDTIDGKQPFLQQIIDILNHMHEIFMNLHYDDALLINEKADLQVESTFMKDEIQEFLQKNTI